MNNLKSKFLLLALSIGLTTFCQTRPNIFFEYSNPPKWQKNASGEFEVSKDGYKYKSSEFVLIEIPDGNVLIVYSLTEDVTFICKNYNTVPNEIPVKIIMPTGSRISFPNTVYYAKADGTYWVFDKGKFIKGKLDDSGICIYNCGDQQRYYRYIGENGITYAIKAGVRPYGTGFSTYIQLPKEELVSIPTW